MKTELVQKLSEAIATAAETPAVLEQLQATWLEVFDMMSELGIPLPEPAVDIVDRCNHKGLWKGKVGLDYSLYSRTVEAVEADSYHSKAYVIPVEKQAHALATLFSALIEYLERCAKRTQEARVLANAMRKALADEHVQAELAWRALEKLEK
jgi:hypothetical protein